ncbi:hypothetical protein PSEUBRA_001548 [Kalmanozyma brasiliensis GHG001]|uniref:uncharacterized protein n=1 Tax=Kalmanozyma brasiliensis (strain GHG001) TaxID=1365824 RepID=UPI002867F9E5|nr:uncharacterized protein PSEUBRA_001548 [Kalmanozyma brasiliensis GHG001]KAF6766959.1 hypothetical protein PSEUBRA_001548 [Kalmanozyma brasiliensis GHG001]
MASTRAVSRLVIHFALACLLSALLTVNARSAVSAQYVLKRDDADDKTHIGSAAAQHTASEHSKKEHEQPSQHGTHRSANNKGDGLSEHTLKSWLHRLGLKANNHQATALYHRIQTKEHRHRHGKSHAGHEASGRSSRNGSHHEGKAGRARGSGGKGKITRPVPVVVTSPGLSRPRGGSDGVGHSSMSPTTQNSSPIAAAVAPLPEPASTLPAPTSSRSSNQSRFGDQFIPPPVPIGGVVSPDTLPPLTIPPSSTSCTSEGGTSGISPSSTPPPFNKNLIDGGDARLDPLLNSSNSSGQSISGIPIARDDGDAKAVQPQVANATKTGAGGRVGSGAGRGMELDGATWTIVAVGIGLVVTVLFFAV